MKFKLPRLVSILVTIKDLVVIAIIVHKRWRMTVTWNPMNTVGDVGMNATGT